MLVATGEEPQERLGRQVVRIGITLVDGHPVLRMRVPVNKGYLDVFTNVVTVLVDDDRRGRGRMRRRMLGGMLGRMRRRMRRRMRGRCRIATTIADVEISVNGQGFVRSLQATRQDDFVVASREWEVRT